MIADVADHKRLAEDNANKLWQQIAGWIPTWITPARAADLMEGVGADPVRDRRELAQTLADVMLEAHKDNPDGREHAVGWMVVHALQCLGNGTLDTTRIAAVEVDGRLQMCLVTTFEDEGQAA